MTREKILDATTEYYAALIKAALLHYNHVRPHQSRCGRTPAWKAGIRISGTDKWLILIQNAAVMGT